MFSQIIDYNIIMLLSLSHAPTAPLLGASAISGFALRNTAVGQSFSPPMLSFCMALGFSNIGLLPITHPIYDACASRILPLAVSLGLLSANGSGAAETSNTGTPAALTPMLTAFAIGAIGTLLGALLSYHLYCPRLLARPAAACAAGLMAATYVGGSANFFAVATASQAAARFPGLIPSLLAADLALMGVFLLALTTAARAPFLRRIYPLAPALDGDRAVSATSSKPAEACDEPLNIGDCFSSSAAVLTAVFFCRAATAVESACQLPGSGIVALCAASTFGSSAISRLRPKLARRLAAPLGEASLFLGCLFLASVGASARISELLAAGPAAAAFAATVLFVHMICMLLGVRAANRALGTNISLAHMIIASNANVGGSGTAIAMASALGWPRLVAPAAVCGALGYASATALGLGLEAILLRGGS